MLLHLLDITYKPEQDILEDYRTIQEEMAAFNPELSLKPQMVIINKMDLHGSGHRNLEDLQKALDEMGIVSLHISALTGEGVDELKDSIFDRWVF